MSLDIGIQLVNLGIILTGMGLVLRIMRKPKYRGLTLWGIPILFLLVNSAIFRVVFIFQFSGPAPNLVAYGLWSDIIHALDKVTIIVYAWAILAQNKRNGYGTPGGSKINTRQLKDILGWRARDDE